MFASASPILNFDEDVLGYGSYARSLALGIANRKNISEPYIVGIDAAWGMGKTSAVNLIQKALEDFSVENPGDERRVHVHHFSPWLLSSLDALALTYIAEVTGAIQKSFGHRLGSDWETQRTKILRRYGRLISAAAEISVELTVPFLGKLVSEAARAMTEVADEPTETLGRDLRSRLAKLDAGQLVVIIDDLDRLHPDEMRNLLSLVMTFGNLPRVTHLLSYDRAIVDGAMKRSLGHGQDGGPTYLEKIVQLPTALPATNSVLLRDFFFSRLESCVGALDDGDEEHLRDLWRSCLRGILTTPRDVARLANSLAATWPAVSDHAELDDFVGIETLRLLAPDTWRALRWHRRILVGEWDPALREEHRPPTAKEIVANQPTPAIISLISHLFPLTNPDSATNRTPGRGQRSISHPGSVDVYFCFQPGEIVSRSLIEDVIRSPDPKRLPGLLISISSRTELRSALSDLTDRLDQLVVSAKETFEALLTVSDQVIGRPVLVPPSLHDIEVFRDIDELIWAVARSIPEGDRLNVFTNAFNTSPSIAMVTIFWQRLCLRGGVRGYAARDPEFLVPSDDLGQLSLHLANRLSAEAATSRLERTPMLGWLLKIWGETGFGDNLTASARRLAESPWGLLNIIDGIMGHGLGSPGGHFRTIREDMKIPGYSEEQLRERAKELIGSNAMPLEAGHVGRQVLEAYIHGEDWQLGRSK